MQDAAKKGIELLIEIAEHDQLAFFKPHITPVRPVCIGYLAVDRCGQLLQAMVQIASTETVDEDTKHLSLEFILTVNTALGLRAADSAEAGARSKARDGPQKDAGAG